MNVHWATLYKNKTKPVSHTKYNVKKLAQDTNTKTLYQETLTTKITGQATNERTWENLKTNIKESMETSAGFVERVPRNQIADDLQRWSIEQKNLRLQIENTKQPEKYKPLKKQRKSILKQMKARKIQL